ncbi:MAG: hypothetical protein A3C53_00825 [Omnitrophica WOR_2 bacterium RIFCSPHIGHO2_02_FULL_68_15]|nr:MAG: hypothetical protein A3C53_00825 [Omnitrophica WOR_2 bacterium RIFCSPHIGHO2_02_FULL_68_15]
MVAPAPTLPTLNAALNAASALLLMAGFGFIKAKRTAAHRGCMLAAFACSTLFLISYLTYHAQVGSVRFPGQGPVRPLYFAILGTHTVLAAAIVLMALRTLWLAARGRYETHRRWARVTLPLWLYVSVTGVVIYWLLYRSPWGVGVLERLSAPRVSRVASATGPAPRNDDDGVPPAVRRGGVTPAPARCRRHPLGWAGLAAPRGVARRSRPAVGTPRSSRLARLARPAQRGHARC